MSPDQDRRREALLDLRKQLDLTQAAMAKAIGMTLRPYQALEGGEAAVRQIHVLAAERVALARAIAEDNPMLAPASVRREALELARMITEG